jgi:hypothetical protein
MPFAGLTLSGLRRLKEEAFSPMAAVFSGFEPQGDGQTVEIILVK